MSFHASRFICSAGQALYICKPWEPFFFDELWQCTLTQQIYMMSHESVRLLRDLDSERLLSHLRSPIPLNGMEASRSFDSPVDFSDSSYWGVRIGSGKLGHDA